MPFIIAGIILVLLIALFIISAYLSRVATARSEDRMEADSDLSSWGEYAETVKQGRQWIKDHSSERIEINSFDGLTLVGFYIHCEEARGTIILMHGYRSHANLDFAAQAEFLHELGFNLLLPHQRSHGESEGKYITFGVKERYDCQRWAQYAAKRFGEDNPIFLFGVSMGASTVLMASGLELPENVKGIIADCGFTSPWEIIKVVAKKTFHLPPFPFLYSANIISKATADFDYKSYSALTAMKENRLPVLFIHGKDDKFVPPRMTRENYRACRAEKQLLMVDHAGHALSYLANPPLYEQAVSDFINQYIHEQEKAAPVPERLPELEEL